MWRTMWNSPLRIINYYYQGRFQTRTIYYPAQWISHCFHIIFYIIFVSTYLHLSSWPFCFYTEMFLTSVCVIRLFEMYCANISYSSDHLHLHILCLLITIPKFILCRVKDFFKKQCTIKPDWFLDHNSNSFDETWLTY